jgi:hypothetical protein
MIKNTTFSRIDFCENINDIGARNDTYIRDSISILDKIEICALHFYDKYHRTGSLDQQEKLILAYSARIKFYYNVFVKTQAKHNNSPYNFELLDLCDYLRSVVTQNIHDNILTSECRREMLEMLKAVGVTSIDWSNSQNPRYKFKDNYSISDHHMMIKLYKAILGHKIKNNLLEISRRNPPTIRAGLPERDINIRGHYIHLITTAANTLLKARSWEAAAFTSCLGSIIQSDAHDFEIRISEFIATIDFITNPKEIILEIADLKSKRMLKKYLKYKNKYLNLKKQLNLL